MRGGDDEAKARRRVALVHDSVYAYGGAERVLEALLAMFPGAPLYAAGISPGVRLASLGGRPVHTSPLGRLPVPVRARKLLFPWIFGTFRLPADVEVVVSSSSGYAKGVRTPTAATHLSYTHTPLRRAWNPHHLAASHAARGLLDRVVDRIVLGPLRRWDLVTAARVDRYVANSENTARQVRELYGRAAEVVHPPVKTAYFGAVRRREAGDYFLVVARLDPYKRVDLAVRTAVRVGLPLVVVGDGVEARRLRALAAGHPGIRLLGWVGDNELRRLYEGARALLFPGEEDFGIVPVEAQASGVPVIAYAAGGALETVVDGETGVLFPTQSVECLRAAVERFGKLSFEAEVLRRHAARFDEAVFRERMRALVAG